MRGASSKSSRRWDRVVDNRPDRVPVFTRRSKTPMWRRTFCRRNWGGALSTSSTNGRARRSSPESMRSWGRTRGRNGGTTSLTVELAREAAMKCFLTAAQGRRAVTCADRVGRRIETRLGSGPRRALLAQSWATAIPFAVPVQQRPGAGRWRRHHGDARQLQSTQSVWGAWEYPSWRQLFDVGAVGRFPRDPSRRAVGPPAQPVLFRSERGCGAKAQYRRGNPFRARRLRPPLATACYWSHKTPGAWVLGLGWHLRVSRQASAATRLSRPWRQVSRLIRSAFASRGSR